MYKSYYYYGQLAKIITCVKCLIDAYRRYNLLRYALPFPFGNLNSHDYQSDSLNVRFFWFPTVFPGASECVSMAYLGFFPVSPQFFPFPISDFPICKWHQDSLNKPLLIVLQLLSWTQTFISGPRFRFKPYQRFKPFQ